MKNTTKPTASAATSADKAKLKALRETIKNLKSGKAIACMDRRDVFFTSPVGSLPIHVIKRVSPWAGASNTQIASQSLASALLEAGASMEEVQAARQLLPRVYKQL